MPSFFLRQEPLPTECISSCLVLIIQTNNSIILTEFISVTISRRNSEKIRKELCLVRILNNGYSDSSAELAYLA